MKLCLLTAAACLAACTCTPIIPPVDPDPPEPMVDAGADVSPPDAGRDDCELAYQKLHDLECLSETGRALWVSPVDGKTPFSQTCREGYTKGLDYHPQCLKLITDCAQRNDAAKGIWCGGEP